MHESLVHTAPSPSSLLTPQASSTPKKSKQMDQSVSKEAGNMETVDSVYICNVSHIQHKYRCLYPQCTNIYLTVSGHIKHGENMHEIKSKGDFKCVKCKIVCGGVYNKRNHVCPKDLSPDFFCQKCTFVCKSREHLETHIKRECPNRKETKPDNSLSQAKDNGKPSPNGVMTHGQKNNNTSK